MHQANPGEIDLFLFLVFANFEFVANAKFKKPFFANFTGLLISHCTRNSYA